MSQENPLFTISEVSRRLNIPKHTLRFWEKEFEGIIIPPRTRGRQRRYTPKHVALIEEIQRRRQRGMSLPNIRDELNHGNSAGLCNSGNIDLLANRVAEVVKTEVFHFFEREGRKD